MVYVLFRIVFLVSLSTQVYNRTIMNELNCGQEEQYAGPEKKKSTSKIVKRTLVVAALALAVYVVYSVVYLFVSPDRNIQQIYLVPEDAAFSISIQRLWFVRNPTSSCVTSIY